MLPDSQTRALGLLVLLILETLTCAVYSAIAICLTARTSPVRQRELIQPLLNSWRNASLLFLGCYLFNEVWIRALL